ncbi:MAG: NINE protein [Burkholderiales bacterium]|nr:NINE protein [Burkholderiales bacterium]
MAGDMKKCQFCGEMILAEAVKCRWCKSSLIQVQSTISDTSKIKDQTGASLLCALLGGFGAHWFYLNKMSLGILYFLFFWTGIPALISIFDFYRIAFASQEEFARKYSGGKISSPVNRFVKFIGILFPLIILVGIIAAICVPQYQAYVARSKGLSMSSSDAYENLPLIQVMDLVMPYAENTVAADQMYKGKKFKITGVISNISTDILNEPYITLSTNGAAFLEPQFKFDSSNLNLLAQLRKGQVVTMVCIGAGDVVKTPISNSCKLIEEQKSTSAQGQGVLTQMQDGSDVQKLKEKALDIFHSEKYSKVGMFCDSVSDETLDSGSFGTETKADLNGRVLPAVIIRYNYTCINRRFGTKKQEYTWVTFAFDEEFKIYRCLELSQSGTEPIYAAAKRCGFVSRDGKSPFSTDKSNDNTSSENTLKQDTANTSSSANAERVQSQENNYNANIIPPNAPSLDCTKAKSTTEKLICSDVSLASREKEMVEAFLLAKDNVSKKMSIDEYKQFMAENKSRWIERESNCQNKQCLNSWFNNRMSELQMWISTAAIR